MSQHEPYPARLRAPRPPLGRLALSALALGVWAGTAFAQDPAPQGPSPLLQQETTPAVEGRGRKSIVHLSTGQILRVRARESADGWEIRKGREWRRLPAGQVTRVVPEKDVVEQARRLQAQLGNRKDIEGNAVRHVAWCDWCLGEGLYEEALQELDRVLAVVPDQKDALDLLRRRKIPLGLPALSPASGAEELDAFFKVAAKTNPAAQEIAVLRLDQAREIPGLIEDVRARLTSRSPQQREFAAHVLRRLFTGREVKPLLRRAILDSSSDVRDEASLALRDVGDAAVILPAVRALDSKHATVRENAVQALTMMAYPAAVEPLYNHMLAVQSGGSRAPHANIFVGRQFSYVQDFDVEVASGAAVADPIINVGMEGAALDAAVIGATSVRFVNQLSNIRRGLSTLTGATPGNSTAAWKKWWNEHGEEWKADRIPPGPRSSPRSPGD